MDLRQFVLLVSCVFCVALSQECENGAIQGEGCRSYQLCEDGTWNQVDCPYPDQAYDFNSKQCVPYADATPPCDQVVDCAGLADGSYPDVELGCVWFYTCNGERYTGHTPCNPGLVFHFTMQLCNWPYNVAPPCGTCGTCTP